MNKNFRNIINKIMASVLMSMMCISKVWADGFPETEDFADGAEDLGAFEVMFWLFEKGAQLAVLGLAVFFALTIGKGAMKKYDEISEGQGSWINLGGHVIGGLVLLALTVVMFNWVGTWVET